MKRKTPHRFEEFYKTCVEYDLSHPFGRALKTCQRLQMVGEYNIGLSRESNTPWAQMVRDWEKERPETHADNDSHLKFLRSIRPSTCIRLERHWKNGGALRHNEMSQVEYNARVRERRKECKKERAEWEERKGKHFVPTL